MIGSKMFGTMEFKNSTNPRIGQHIGAITNSENGVKDICDSSPHLCGMEAGCYSIDNGKNYICICHDLKPAGPNNSCERSNDDSLPSSTHSSVTGTMKQAPTEGSFGSHQLLGMLSPSTTGQVNISETGNATQSSSSTSSFQTPNSYRASYTIIIPSVLAIFIVVIICLVIFIYKRKRGFMWCFSSRAHDVAALSLNKCMQHSVTNPNYYTNSPESPLITALRDLEIHQENIEMLEEIGEGFFGKVYKGVLKTNSEEPVQVAIKTLKDNISPEAMTDFEREVHIMASFRHDNILRLLGVVIIENASPQMVFEFMTHGDLANVLRSNNSELRLNPSPKPDIRLTKSDLVMISHQIARGMKYLSEQHFVHRDLATRNCLVGDRLRVKISDFGMSRDIYTSDYYRVGGSRMLPVRWMAPESISYGKFSLESDVWSYGVVLWEIFTYGKQPYYGHCNEEVIELVSEGKLLKPPEDCPSFITTIMEGCWKLESWDRMTFNDIYIELHPHAHGRHHTATMAPRNIPQPPEDADDTLVEIDVTPV